MVFISMCSEAEDLGRAMRVVSATYICNYGCTAVQR
jgi:hypothetical protein